MDFGLTEEQQQLKDSARNFLSRECPSARIREIMADDAGMPRDLYQQIANLGWNGLIVSEKFGGAGLGMLDMSLLLEECGYAALPGPEDDAPQGVLACLANFSALPYDRYRIGLPQAGRWREVLNTDASDYGGTGTGNLGAVEAVAEPWHGRPASATVTLPPLGVLWLIPEPGAAPD